MASSAKRCDCKCACVHTCVDAFVFMLYVVVIVLWCVAHLDLVAMLWVGHLLHRHTCIGNVTLRTKHSVEHNSLDHILAVKNLNLVVVGLTPQPIT